MEVVPGTRVGSYELLDQIGAGGMGVVFSARDLRLGRRVAIKVLPGHLDPIKLQRFEQEARAAAALSDPHVVAIYDVGFHDGRPFIVSELLEGETLRHALSPGRLPVRKALDYGRQIARGLAAAHRRGVVHRDLKPENVFITSDGQLKILDFGLAKLTQTTDGLHAETVTTANGVVLGTVGYMSPEQARGEHADHRADIFSFGAVLFELLSGRKAFEGDSAADTLSAILKEHPPDLLQLVNDLPPAVDRIVQRCLEKNREDRFQSATDLGFALGELTSVAGGAPIAPPSSRLGMRRFAAAAAVIAIAVAAYMAGMAGGPTETPAFQQLTFRRGTIQAARFAGDGQTIVYAAAWEGEAAELFSTRPDSTEARTLGHKATGLFAISSKDEIAVALNPEGYGRVEGTLGRVALAGGVPRELAHGVLAADWAPDGSALAVVQVMETKTVLQYPAGTTFYDPAPAYITHARFSPSGDAIAVIVHPVSGDTAGSVVLVDMKGQATTLSSGWNSVLGLGWAPDGLEVWFTAARTGASQAMYAVSRSGRERLLLQAPGTLMLHDVSSDGHVLLSRDAWGGGVIALPPGAQRERELSWLDGTTAWDLSADGTTLLLEEAWEGGGAARSIYLRTTDGAPALRLGDGVPLALSPDKQWVLSMPVEGDRLALLPTGVGQVRALDRGNIRSFFPSARFLPDGQRFLVSGAEEGKRSRVYEQSIDGGSPRAVVPEGVFGRLAVLPDGKSFVTRGLDRRLARFSLQTGEGVRVRGAEPRDLPIVCSADGAWLYVQTDDAQIARVHLDSGRREVVRRLIPPDPAGLSDILRVVMTPDGRAYAYSYVRALSALYLVEGIS